MLAGDVSTPLELYQRICGDTHVINDLQIIYDNRYNRYMFHRSFSRLIHHIILGTDAVSFPHPKELVCRLSFEVMV